MIEEPNRRRVREDGKAQGSGCFPLQRCGILPKLASGSVSSSRDQQVARRWAVKGQGSFPRRKPVIHGETRSLSPGGKGNGNGGYGRGVELTVTPRRGGRRWARSGAPGGSVQALRQYQPPCRGGERAPSSPSGSLPGCHSRTPQQFPRLSRRPRGHAPSPPPSVRRKATSASDAKGGHAYIRHGQWEARGTLHRNGRAGAVAELGPAAAIEGRRGPTRRQRALASGVCDVYIAEAAAG